eukprot:5591891-Prymnesium_polylepis.1
MSCRVRERQGDRGCGRVAWRRALSTFLTARRRSIVSASPVAWRARPIVNCNGRGPIAMAENSEVIGFSAPVATRPPG